VCDKLQPFGLQNNQPLFIIENATLGTPKALGNGGKHLKWQAKKEGTSFDVIGFGFGAKQDAVNLEQANLLGYLEANTWRDNTKLQLRLVDLAPSDRNIETV
jgi:single-stranded-DNA-specific exonuclease